MSKETAEKSKGTSSLLLLLSKSFVALKLAPLDTLQSQVYLPRIHADSELLT